MFEAPTTSAPPEPKQEGAMPPPPSSAPMDRSEAERIVSETVIREHAPKADTPTNETGRDSASEKPLTPASEGTPEITGEKLKADLSPENRGFFSRMSESAHKLVTGLYERVYSIPGVNRVVGRIEIAFNQIWVDKHQERAIELAARIGSIDSTISPLEKSKEEIKAVIISLQKQGIPGSESLNSKVKEIEGTVGRLMMQRESTRIKLEDRNGKLRTCTEQRDVVANKLISHYGEQLRPIEAELDILRAHKDGADLEIAVAKARHNEQVVRLKGVEDEMARVKEILLETGMSEDDVEKFEAIRQMTGMLAGGYQKIRAEEESLSQKKALIEKKIGETRARTRPYLSRMQEFDRIKLNRPSAQKVPLNWESTVPEVNTEASAETESSVEGAESREQITIGSFIKSWNDYLLYKNGNRPIPENINENDFLNITHLSPEFRIKFDDFKNILENYFKSKNLLTDKYRRSINGFYGEIIVPKHIS